MPPRLSHQSMGRFTLNLGTWIRQGKTSLVLVIRRASTRYRLVRRALRHAKQRLLFRGALFLNRRQHQSTLFLRRLLNWIGRFHATLTALALAGIFALSLPDSWLENSNLKVSEVHLACAGIIGTALALVLTLS